MKKTFSLVVFVFLTAVNMLFLPALRSPSKADGALCRARCSNCECRVSGIDGPPCFCYPSDFSCRAVCGAGNESVCDATGTCPPSGGGGGGGAPGGGAGSGGSGTLCTDWFDPWCDFVNSW